MHIHILGICGTFMGGVAALARAAGFSVSGSDRNVYSPMSTQLQALGIAVTEGFDAAQITVRNLTATVDPYQTTIATRDIMTDLRAGK